MKPVSIRTKIIVMAAGTMLVAILLASFLIRQLVYKNIVSQKMTTVDILSASIVHDIKQNYAVNQQESVQGVVAKFMTYYRIIKHISFYDTYFKVQADSSLSRIGQTTKDPDILQALTKARPNIKITRSDWSNVSIRSVSPIIQGSKIVGAVAIEVSIQDIQATLSSIDRHIALIVIIAVLIASAFLYILLKTSILPRLQRLIRVTHRIAAGDYAIQIDDHHGDEIGQLSSAFEQMTRELKRSREEIQRYHAELEERIQEATAQLQQTYEDLKSAQSQIVLNEKMASLGVLISGIAHEINTPVGAIHNVVRNLEKNVLALPAILIQFREEPEVQTTLLVALLEDLLQASKESLTALPYQKTRDLEANLRTLGISNWREMAESLVKLNFVQPQQMEKYQSLLKTPSLFKLVDAFGNMAQAVKISESSSNKIKEIVRALKYYAYTDKDKTEETQLNESIQTALILLRNRLKHSVQIETDLDPHLPLIACTSEIHQVWTNLLNNACDAIEERGPDHTGLIQIRTFTENLQVHVHISDNGMGIPPEKIGRIFDPFFTTKDIGKGTGLGLSIVSGILKKHRGTIQVDCHKGFTTFMATLPMERVSDLAAGSSRSGDTTPYSTARVRPEAPENSS